MFDPFLVNRELRLLSGNWVSMGVIETGAVALQWHGKTPHTNSGSVLKAFYFPGALQTSFTLADDDKYLLLLIKPKSGT